MPSEKVKITKSLLEKLKSEMVRTGVGAYKLSTISKSRERHILPGYIENLIRERTKTVDITEFDYVLAIYKSLPDGNIEITKEMRDFIDKKLSELGRVSVGMIANHSLKPKSLSVRRIEGFLKHKNSKINQDEWDYIVERLNTIKPSDVVELSDEDIGTFRTLFLRKKLSTVMLEKYIKVKYNKHFKTSHLQDLFNSQISHIETRDWDIIIQSLEMIPPIKTDVKITRKTETIPLTSEMARKIDQEIDRTRTEYRLIVNAAPSNFNLDRRKVSNIRRGTIKKIDPKIWNFLVEYFNEKPDAILPKKTP